MTPAEKEAEKVNQAYQDALVALGAKMVIETMAAFESANIRTPEGFASFSARAASLIYLYRRKARNLAMAAAQLERALLTGSTFNDWIYPFKEQPSLGGLRSNLNSLLGEFGIKPLLRARTHPHEQLIRFESIPAIERIEKSIDGELDREIDTTLRILGEEALRGGMADVKDDTPFAEANKLEKALREQVASRVAAGAERIALNGARHQDSNIIQFDPKAVGWVRIHASSVDRPCGWCSMLMSRGAVYKTEAAALLKGEGSKFSEYHANCHCVAVKVYSKAQYDSPRFDENRKYQKLWPEVTKGLTGDDALSAWRKYIREQNPITPVTLAVAA